MDQQNMSIAAVGIIVALGILAVGFNKMSPDNIPPEYSFENRSTTLGWRDTYPDSRRDVEYEEVREEPRRPEAMVGGRTLCKRCNSRNTRRK